MVNSITGWGNDNTLDVAIADGGEPGAPLGKPAAAGVQGGIPAVAWISGQGVQVQFFDILRQRTAPAGDVFSKVLLSEGPGKSNVQIADAILAFGVAWQEGTPAHGVIKLRAVPAEALPVGQEVTVGDAALNNHSVSIGGYHFATNVTIPDPADPVNTINATASGINVAWVASPDGDATGLGRIMLQRYQIVVDAAGEPAALLAAGLDGQNEDNDVRDPADAAAIGAANDNAIWVGREDGDDGFVGRDPAVTGLHTGDVLISWIGADNHVRAKLYPPNGTVVPSDANNDVGAAEYAAVNAALADLGAVTELPNGGRRLQVAELGPGNFAIMWVALGTAGIPQLHGSIFSTPPDNAAGDALDGGWTKVDVAPILLPSGFSGDFSLTGMGEANPDLIVTYTAPKPGLGVDVFAVRVDGLIGRQPGQHSDPFLVDTTPAGDQSGGAVTGMVGDRVMVAYLDGNSGDILARLLDTREAGLFLQGDEISDGNDNGILDAGDRIGSRPDVIVGTTGDDTIIGDLIDPDIAGVHFDGPQGSDDELYGGLGNDVIYGGGGNDIIDGGRDLVVPGGGIDPTPGQSSTSYVDKAIYQGNWLDYSVSINGDGSYSVLDARFDDGGNVVDALGNGTVNRDGLDLVSNVEVFEFVNEDLNSIRNLSYPDQAPRPTTPGTHQFLNAADLYHLPSQDQRTTGDVNADGTPAVDGALGIETVLTPVGWAETQDAAANGGKLAGDAADTEQQFAPIVRATAEAFVVAWETPGAALGAVGIRMSMYDPLGRPTLVDGGPGTVIAVTDNAAAGETPAMTGIGAGAVAAYVTADQGTLAVQAFDLDGLPIGTTLSVDTPTGGAVSDVAIAGQAVDGALIEDQFAVVCVQDNGDADAAYGDIIVQRYGVAVDANDVPQQPVALGLDGAAGVGSDVPAQLTVNTGTVDAPVLENAVGRDPQAVGLHNGQLAIVWVGPDGAGHETIQGAVIEPAGNQVLHIDLTGLLPPTGIAEGTHPILAGAGEGGILVSWLQEDTGGGYVVMAAIYKAAGVDAWTVPEAPIRLQEFDGKPKEFSVSVVGEADVSLIVTWRENSSGSGSNHDVQGQRFDTAGTIVGTAFAVTGNRPGDADSQSASDVSAAAGMLDGRFVVVYTEAGRGGDVDIEARMFDTRSAEAPNIGGDGGGPHGSEVGTVFDDIIDGRDRADELHGGLGDDVLIGGLGGDALFGGAGADTLVGGTGTDNLAGGDGDDLLMGGHGRDYIAGGAGTDTISYRGEARAVVIDLAAGTVHSDAAHNAVVLPGAASTINGLPADALTDASLEDLLGQLVEIDRDAEIFEFQAATDIENAEGGLGNDSITGNANDNVLTGGGGNDILDGGGGFDTAAFSGLRDEYVITQTATGFIVRDTVADRDGTDTLGNIEQLQFLDFTGARDQSLPGGLGASSSEMTIPEDATDGVIIDVLGSGLAAGLRVAQINGTNIASGGAPLQVSNGFVQLRSDGQLLFTADANFHGTQTFDFTVADSADRLATATMTVHVTPQNDAPAAISLSNSSVAENALGAVIGAVSVVDPDLADTHVVTVTDDRFEVVAGNLKLKAGQSLEFEAAPSINLSVTAKDADGLAATQAFVINVLNGNEAPVGITPDAAAVVENTVFGTSVAASLAAVGQDASDHAGFVSASASHVIQVQATDAGGLSRAENITVNIGSVSNPISGLGGDDTPNGTAGDGLVDGCAGDDAPHEGAGNDTFVFQPGFGNDTISRFGDGDSTQDVIDMSLSGYATFAALQAAGALAQVSADVVITFHPLDPANSDKITLKSVSLSTLDATDFKFG